MKVNIELWVGSEGEFISAGKLSTPTFVLHILPMRHWISSIDSNQNKLLFYDEPGKRP
jgi:hypothetical protein